MWCGSANPALITDGFFRFSPHIISSTLNSYGYLLFNRPEREDERLEGWAEALQQRRLYTQGTLNRDAACSLVAGRSGSDKDWPRVRLDDSGKGLAQGWKKPRFKKNQPSGFFFGFFWVFFLVFQGFLYLPRREFLEFFRFKNTLRCIQILNYNHSY